MAFISCSDDDEPKRGDGVFTVNYTMVNHMYDTNNGQPLGFATTRNKLTFDTVNHKGSLEFNYNDGHGDKILKISDITGTSKRPGFYLLSSPSNNAFSGYVNINEDTEMRYFYTTADGIRIISTMPEVFFLKTDNTVTYDDTTKATKMENVMYQFTINPANQSAIVQVMDIVHAKDRKYFYNITAASAPITATADGFTINATNLKTDALYSLHYTDSLGSTKSHTDKYPFKTFNATIDLVNDRLDANFMMGGSATVVASGKTYPDYGTTH